MAENKKSFILYSDTLSMVEKLPNEKAGELFKMILEYVNDKQPQTDDLLLQIAFEPIKLQLKRDLRHWEETIISKSLSGRLGNLKRWNIDLYNKVIDKSITIEDAEIIANGRKVSHTDKTVSQRVAKVAVNDTVTVTVNDTVNDTVIKEKKEKTKVFIAPTFDEAKKYFNENGYSDASAQSFIKYYDAGDWTDSKGNKVKNWKQKAQSVWFKDENALKVNNEHVFSKVKYIIDGETVTHNKKAYLENLEQYGEQRVKFIKYVE